LVNKFYHKTRLIITDSAEILKNCDQIIVFDNGYINAIEKYDDLIENYKCFKNVVQKGINQNFVLKNLSKI